MLHVIANIFIYKTLYMGQSKTEKILLQKSNCSISRNKSNWFELYSKFLVKVKILNCEIRQYSSLIHIHTATHTHTDTPTHLALTYTHTHTDSYTHTYTHTHTHTKSEIFG